jgi:hypothetical protein
MSRVTYTRLMAAADDDEVLNLPQAVALIGGTTGRLYYKPVREKLRELGAQVDGREWRVPKSALLQVFPPEKWKHEKPASNGLRFSADELVSYGDDSMGQRAQQASTDGDPLLGEDSLSVRAKSRIEQLANENIELRQQLAVSEALLTEKQAELERSNDIIKALTAK